MTKRNKAFDEIDGMKRCSNPNCCIKPISEFYFDRRRNKCKSECNDCRHNRGRVRYKAHQSECDAANAEWVRTHADRVRARNRAWYSRNKEMVKKRTAENTRAFRKTVLGKLHTALRSSVRRILGGNSGAGDLVSLYLGCNQYELKTHIESLWQPTMNWGNYGYSGWHVDHIIPVASVKSESDIEQIKRVCHYTNLRPLWAKDNLSKGAKLIEEDGDAT
jgi:hypothetical protein